MVRVLLLAALVAAGTAQAAGDDVRCKQIGAFAHLVAQARDQGIAKADVLAKLPAGDSPARHTVEGIYHDRQISPDEAASGLELTCLLDAARVNPNTYRAR